jgi:hypothetical protein
VAGCRAALLELPLWLWRLAVVPCGLRTSSPLAQWAAGCGCDLAEPLSASTRSDAESPDRALAVLGVPVSMAEAIPQ